ncbi:hypothetical protein HYV50_01110 [Candidatus Pacearchaeota archaeon]|nr:hypothetical protein [Candidatus Pacearchaeota archaeon]
MKSKKANLSNLVGAIIAIVGLSLFFFVAIPRLYGTITSDKETESAKSLANVVEAKIKAFLESDFTAANITVQGFNENWYLAGWGKNDLDRPEKCYFDSCICICKSESPSNTLKDSCQKNGICRKIEIEKISIEEPFLLEKKGQGSGQLGEGQIEYYSECYGKSIDLFPQLIEIELSKKQDKFIIRYLSEAYKQKKQEIETERKYEIKKGEGCF